MNSLKSGSPTKSTLEPTQLQIDHAIMQFKTNRKRKQFDNCYEIVDNTKLISFFMVTISNVDDSTSS